MIFGNLIGNGIELPGQDSLTQRGTFGAVKAFIDKYIKKDIFPLLILYGDTLVEGNFLEHIIDQYDKEQKGSKIIWGLVKHETKDKKSMGDVVTKPIDIPKDDFYEIDEKNIIDIFEQQKKIKESYDLLHDTGIMLLSEDAWNVIYDQIDKLQPSSHGIFSFTSILRQILIFKNLEICGFSEDLAIDISSSVASEDCWSEANYPWEILDLNKQKILDSVKDAKLTYKEDEPRCIEKDTKWTKERYLFSWDNIPGSDIEELIVFFKEGFDINWAKNANVRKSDDGKSIRISKDENSAEITIDDEEKNATIKISDGTTHNWKVKKENDKLEIFGERIILVKKDVILSLSMVPE